MPWEKEMVTMLRYMISDLAEPPTYSDSRLEETILVCAQLVSYDLKFPNTYTVDISSGTLSPDPTDGTKDNAFINLVTTRAACLVDNALFRSKSAIAGIEVRSGTEMIKMSSMPEAYKLLLDSPQGWCALYQQMKKEYMFGGGGTIGAAIMTPIAGYFGYTGISGPPRYDIDHYRNY